LSKAPQTIGQQAKKSSKIARLRAARLAAVQAVYQMRQNDQDAKTVLSEFKAHRIGKPYDTTPEDDSDMVIPDGTLMTSIVEGTEARFEDIEGIVRDIVEKPSKEGASSGNMPKGVLGVILSCGTYELLAHHEIDVPVIISDYLDITHAFYEGSESKLVNGVLDQIAKAVRDGAAS
jgi:N utilization substance protein B